ERIFFGPDQGWNKKEDGDSRHAEIISGRPMSADAAASGLRDVQSAIRRNVLQGLNGPARPMYFDGRYQSNVSQADVDSGKTGGGVSGAGRHRIRLIGHADHGANAVAIAASAGQLQQQPMISGLRSILPQLGGLAERAHDDIQLAIAIEIGR